MLGPIDWTCDAPPYPIVVACGAIGVERPEDSPWRKYRMARRWCCKNTRTPVLAKFRFTYSSGDEVTYAVGQCPRCRTVYWMEA